MERQKITRNLKVLYAAFAVALLVSGGVVYAAVANNGQALTEAIQSSQVDEDLQIVPEASPATEDTTTEATEAPVDYDQPASAEVSPKNSPPQSPAPTSSPAPQLERIPFTNKDVTPGDPSSYVDTYGQCPFYENAGAKGCYPPPGITCNADWSHCTMSEATPTSTEEDHTDGQ